jgi:sulfur-carrier protein
MKKPGVKEVNPFMALLIKLSSSLRPFAQRYDPHHGLEMDIRPGATVADIIRELGIPLEKVKIIMVNGLSAGHDHELRDDDRLSLFPPVGGG